MAKFTKSDIAEIESTVLELNNPDELHCEGCADGSCDCYESETIMLSSGYADVYRDGSVYQFGVLVFEADAD